MINFESIIQAVFKENENIVGDVLGEPAAGTSQFSSDKIYASGETRIPFTMPGIATRRGTIKRKKRKKRKSK